MLVSRGTNISHTHSKFQAIDPDLDIEGGQIFSNGGCQTFYVGGDGGYDDEEIDMSKANKLSAGARIFMGP